MCVIFLYNNCDERIKSGRLRCTCDCVSRYYNVDKKKLLDISVRRFTVQTSAPRGHLKINYSKSQKGHHFSCAILYSRMT